MLSLLYENGKAYFYSKDKDGNIAKGDAWDGKDGFIEQAVTDLNDVASTKQGKTVVGDLQSSKYGYSISETDKVDKSSFDSQDGSNGGGNILYSQKGGSHANASMNKSAVVLGHELYHGWAFEFTNQSRETDFGARLSRETSAVKFENYLRASFGETVMRTDYRIGGGNEKVASSSVKEAKNYRLPVAKYNKLLNLSYPTLAPHADNTINREGRRPIFIDSRTQKF